MIFTRTVQTLVGKTGGQVAVEAEVDFHIDEAKLVKWLGTKALQNMTGRSQVNYGSVVAEVRNGSRRMVELKS